MEIKRSKGPPATSLPEPPPTAEELAAEYQRAARERERRRHLEGCPPELASFAAGVCALVYHPFLKVKDVLAQAGADGFEGFDCGGTQAVVFTWEGRDWIVFRGSQSFPETEMFLDWGHDLLAVPWGWPPLHLGFAHAWSKLRKPVLEWIAKRQTPRGLVISGHSLGGALALAGADEIARLEAGRIEAVITFGAPKVGTWPWAARYHRRNAAGGEAGVTLREVTWRVHNSGDIVTYVPPLLFSHCGRSVESSFMQAGPAVWGVRGVDTMGSDTLAPGLIGKLKFGYGTARKALPYSPLTLLIDLLCFLGESAPQHFMRHYGPAFPDRAFQEVGEPKRPPGSRDALNTCLCVLKGLIIGIFLVGLLALGWLTFHLSPELAGGLLIATIVYALIGMTFESTPTVMLPGLAKNPKPPGV